MSESRSMKVKEVMMKKMRKHKRNLASNLLISPFYNKVKTSTKRKKTIKNSFKAQIFQTQ